jgi:hypothetical protein
MLVYNISFQIAPTLQGQWLEWMKSKFIPMVQGTECFVDHKFYEIDIAEDQAPTYTLQLFTPNPKSLSQYQETSSTAVMDELQNTWGNQCFHFITTMRIVN